MRRGPGILLIVSTLGACSIQGRGLATVSDPAARADSVLLKEERIAARVLPDSALANVRELVSFGPRMGGTTSGDRAAAAVASRLREIGLQVVVVDDPPQKTHEVTAWKVALGPRLLGSAWPYNFSPSIQPTSAPLVPEPASGAQGSADLEGAVVLTGRAITPGGYTQLAARGAIAVLTDMPGDPNRYIDWAPIRDVPETYPGAPRIPIFGVSYRDGRLLREALETTSDTGSPTTPPRVTLELEAKTAEGRPRTVIATLQGAGGRKDEILIVCAHGDSDAGGPGADDNASGVASLIEVARALSSAAADGLLPASRPSVRFIVWGAEYRSSAAYVAANADEMPRVKAVFNYDETGTGAERDAVYYEGNDVPWNEPLLRLIESVAEEHSGKPGFPTVWTSCPSQGGTDTGVFLPRKYLGLDLVSEKIPATTVFTAAWDRPGHLKQTRGWKSKGWPEEKDLFIDYSEYYHSSGDTPANTTDAEPWNMERCAKLVTVAIYRLMEG